MEPILNGLAFPGLVLAWSVFGIAALRSPQGLAGLWPRFRTWSLLIQGLAWLILLPVVLAAWIAHVSWPLVFRLPLIAGLAAVSLYVMVPGR